MLPRSRRLAREDFDSIRRRGASVSGQYLVLRIARTFTATPARAGIIVPKKLIAKATARNAVRRRIRRALTPLIVHSIPGVAVLVLVRPAVRSATLLLLQRELSSLFHRARLLTA